MKLIQFGCGRCAPEGWTNYDASPTLRLSKIPVVGRPFLKKTPFPKAAKYGDIVKGLPEPGSSVDAVYSSHTLEHLSLKDFRIAIRNVRSLLRDGGVFRSVLPDLERLCNDYLRSNARQPAIEFMNSSLLSVVQRPRSLRRFATTWLGNSIHLWMWDFRSIAVELDAAGFRNVRRATFGDSSIPRFTEVENPERWEDALGFECVR